MGKRISTVTVWLPFLMVLVCSLHVAMSDDDEDGPSWVEWAKDFYGKNFDFTEHAETVMNKAGDAANQAVDSMKGAAEKVNDVANQAYAKGKEASAEMGNKATDAATTSTGNN